MVLTSFNRAESLSRFSNSFRRAKSMFSPSSKEALPPQQQEKKQFTEPEKIRVPALYNEKNIKRRKSFTVEADVIIQDGDILGATAANDPSRQIGCLLKPHQSMRDMMSPQAQGVQTWHKKTNMCSSSPALSRNGYSAPLPGSYAAPSQNGIRNAFALEQALEALEEVEEEMKDLKLVLADADEYSENPALQKAMARLASQKKATLLGKLNHIVFEGEDSHVFYTLKEKLQKALNGMSVDWSSGGLDLSPAEVRLGGATPKASSMRGGSVFGGSAAPQYKRETSGMSSVSRSSVEPSSVRRGISSHF